MLAREKNLYLAAPLNFYSLSVVPSKLYCAVCFEINLVNPMKLTRNDRSIITNT